MRVAIVWPTGSVCADLRSGMPIGMQRGLESIGVDVTPVFMGDPGPGWSLLSPPMRDRGLFVRSAWRSGAGSMARRIADHRPDAVLVPACAEVGARLDSPAPVVFATDAPCGFGGPILNGSHQPIPFSGLRRWVHAAAIRRADAVIVGTADARRFTIEAYPAPPDRVHVSALGVNIALPDGAWRLRPPPTPGGVRLVQVAATPERKRVEDCVAAVETLRDRGVRATLSLIGTPTPAARASKAVECLGRLRLSSPDDAATHRAALRDAHAMLMPSRAEAFGIAACEGAHVGLPVIATRVGGLADLVRDGETGLLLPHDAPADAIADAVERLIADPEAWRAMSRAARALAVAEFTWTRWAERVRPVFEGVVTRARAGRRRSTSLSAWSSSP